MIKKRYTVMSAVVINTKIKEKIDMVDVRILVEMGSLNTVGITDDKNMAIEFYNNYMGKGREDIIFILEEVATIIQLVSGPFDEGVGVENLLEYNIIMQRTLEG